MNLADFFLVCVFCFIFEPMSYSPAGQPWTSGPWFYLKCCLLLISNFSLLWPEHTVWLQSSWLCAYNPAYDQQETTFCVMVRTYIYSTGQSHWPEPVRALMALLISTMSRRRHGGFHLFFWTIVSFSQKSAMSSETGSVTLLCRPFHPYPTFSVSRQSPALVSILLAVNAPLQAF